MPELTQPDVVIVGAGTAGCVLASRLSEDQHRTVLLVEAGSDFSRGVPPADIRSVNALSYFNPRYLWKGLQVRWHAGGAPALYSQGRSVGGGSNVMGMWALRGFASDYDEWTAAGAIGWGWQDVLPYFVAAEHDLDFTGPLHGQQGPITIRRQPLADWPPYCRAVSSVAQEIGLTRIDDMNAEFRDGVGVLPIAATDRRVSAASAYLAEPVRSRPNLTIATALHCARVTLEGGRATGVDVIQRGEVKHVRADQVILAAGALQSPAILMRSGIGPREVLQKLGIPLLHERTGVGANLQNHPVVALGLHLAPESVQRDRQASAAFCCLRMSSPSADSATSDLYFSVLNRSSWHHFGRRLATLGVMLHKPRSRGRVRIESANPLADPQVDFGFLSDPRDLDALAYGLGIAAQILCDGKVRSLGAQAGLVQHGRLTRALGTRSGVNRVLDSLLSAVMLVLPKLEHRLFSALLGTVSAESLRVAPPEHQRELVHQAISGVFHPVGTCRMGQSDDPMAVVNSAGCVHGVQGLRVIDASIMPTIPRAGTFLPTVMVAEKISAEIASTGL